MAAEVRREIRAALRRGEGYGSGAHAARVRHLREHERVARNTDGGYWISAYEPSAASRARSGTYSISQGPGELRRLALLSDGVERAVSTLGIWPSWAELLRALSELGPASCISRVRAAELADPDGLKRPRTSPDDDASAIVWEFVRFGSRLRGDA